MTADSEDEDRPRAGVGRSGRSDGQSALTDDIEGRLEELAEEMGRLIDSRVLDERESLRAFAVSLLREGLPARGAAYDEDVDLELPTQPGEDSRPASNGATLIGYGFLLLPASAVLILVFPPIGGLLFVTGFVLMSGGLGWAIVARLVPDSWTFRHRRSTNS